MTTHTITIEPTTIGERGQRYRVTFAGCVLLDSAREPLLDACRALAARGITGRLEMWRPGKVAPDMTADIERAARLTVAETSDVGPELRVWRPFAREDAEHAFPPVRLRPGMVGSEFQVGGPPKNNRPPVSCALPS